MQENGEQLSNNIGWVNGKPLVFPVSDTYRSNGSGYTDKHPYKLEGYPISEEEDDQPHIETILWGELNAKVFPVDRWRVKNLIPKGGSTILAAVSGEGKTWVSLDLARCIATGTNFLNQEQFLTVQGKVLYIDGENAMSEIQRRGRQLRLPENDQLHFAPVDTLNLNDEDTANELIGKIIDEHFDVVIIDTFRAVAGGLKEEKAEEVRAFFNRFKPLKEQGVSLIWLDHYRKPANFEGKLPKKEFLFGSQDKTAGLEVLLMMKKENSEITLYQRKNRLGMEIQPFKMLLQDEEGPEDGVKTTLSYGGEIDERESKKEEAKEYIPDILSDGPKTTPEIMEAVYREKKIGQRNVREALKELLAEGVLDRYKVGRKDQYFLVSQIDSIVANSDEDNELAKLFDSS